MNSAPKTTESPGRNRTISRLDRDVLDALRRTQSLGIAEFTKLFGVTRTAIRQRLSRLMKAGLIERQPAAAGRGRPRYQYGLTDVGRSTAGSNFADLAIALWDEIRSIEHVEVRRGLLQRLSQRLADWYRHEIVGENVEDRMRSLVSLCADREIPFEVDMEDDLPVLSALACPYNDLAEKDRTICSMEKMLFSELLGHGLKLSQCRLDGDACCKFELN